MKLSETYVVLGKRSVPSKSQSGKNYFSLDLYSQTSGFISLPCSVDVFSAVDIGQVYLFSYSFYPDRKTFPLKGRLYVESVVD